MALTEAEELEMIELLEQDLREFPVRPHPDNPKQKLLVKTFADITFFGGAADGGKTFSIFILALTHHKRTCIYRKTYPEAAELSMKLRGVVEAAGGKVRLNGTEFILGDRLIHIRSIGDWAAVQGLKGNTYDLMAFDECSDFPEEWIQFLMTWNRSPDPNQLCRILLTSNPPTSSEGMWLRNWFRDWIDKRSPNHKESGEIGFYYYHEGIYYEAPSKEPVVYQGRTFYPMSYAFIQAMSVDNPFSSEAFRNRLANMPELMRRAYLDGDWGVMDSEDVKQFFPSMWIEMAIERAKTMPDGLPLHSIGCDVAGSADIEKRMNAKPSMKPDNSSAAFYDGNKIARIESVAGTETQGGEAYLNWLLSIFLRDSLPCPPNLNIDSVWGGAYEYVSKSDFFGAVTHAIHFGQGLNLMTDDGMLDLDNVKVACYWYFRMRLDPNGDNPIGLCDDRKLIAGLKSIRFSVSGRKIILEKKIDMRERVGFSPDEAESAIYALAHEIMGGDPLAGMYGYGG